MDESKEDALQAALLAKFVSSSLNKIDSLAVDPRSRANRLDVNQFVSKVVNNNQGQQYNQQNMGQPPIPRGFAAPPPEDVIRQMVPDVPRHQPPPPQQTSTQSIPNSSNIESILSNIDKNLETLVKFIKNG
jgi:hypothetical protein